MFSLDGLCVSLGFCRQLCVGNPCWVKQAGPQGRAVPQVHIGSPGFGLDSSYTLYLILKHILIFYKDSGTRDQEVLSFSYL